MPALMLALAGAAAQAQTAPAPQPAPSPPAPTQPAPAPAPAQPAPGSDLESLDELLNLPKPPPRPGDRPAGEPRPAPATPGLEQALSGEEAGDPFQRAIALMDRTAQRLERSRDPGLQTQRDQEEIIRLLDKAMENARRQQQRSRSQSQSQQQQQSDPGQQSQQQAQQQSQAQQRAARADNQGQAGNPAGQEGALGTPEAAAAAAWGNLPDRTRAALLQGLSDRFSALYQSVTEQYYRKLAEEPKP